MNLKEQFQQLNGTDLKIYEYILNHEIEFPYMSIYDLAKEIPTSTASLLRFCKKLGYSGFKEFKYAYKTEMKQSQPSLNYDFLEMISCLEKLNSVFYKERFNQAMTMIGNGENVIFIGVGDSGVAAEYGARCFSQYGKLSISLRDPYIYIAFAGQKTVVIALSVSGETPETLSHVESCIKSGCQIIAVTSSEDSTLAKLSHLTIPYYINHQRTNQKEMTSQVPAVAIIEKMATMKIEK